MGTLTDRFQLLKPDFGDAGAAWDDPVAQNFQIIEDRLAEFGVNVMSAKYGAVGDNSADDTGAFNDARADIPSTGGFVYAPPPPVRYKITSSLDPYTANQRFVGAGQFGTLISFTGTGYLFTFGSTSSSALSYGCGIKRCKIYLTNNAGNGVQFAGTAMGQPEDLIIEGVPSTNSSVGVYWNGGNAANIFGAPSNVLCNHIKTGHLVSSSGSDIVTSLNARNCTSFGDLISGSIGWDVRQGHGSGSHIFGGNLENCVQAIKTDGFDITWEAIRFEANTTDVYWNTNARGQNCIGLQGATTWTDIAASVTNQRIGCMNASHVPLTNLLGAGLVIGGATDPGTGFIQLGEQVEADTTPANTVKIFARDNGGKTELCARFNTGAVQRLAIEP